MEASTWAQAFLAMSAALGEPLDASVSALRDASATALEATLRSGSRETRARAIAQQLALVAADIDAMELTWPA